MVVNNPKIEQKILHLIGETADRMGLECYVIGGWVRDLFLHRESTDIDVVVVRSQKSEIRNQRSEISGQPSGIGMKWRSGWGRGRT